MANTSRPQSPNPLSTPSSPSTPAPYSLQSCGSSLGWAVAGASIAHEVAAELSEFWLLINPKMGNLWWPQALAINVCSSLTTVIGTPNTPSTISTPSTLAQGAL